MENFYKPKTAEQRLLALHGNYNLDHPAAFDDQLLLGTLKELLMGLTVQVSLLFPIDLSMIVLVSRLLAMIRESMNTPKACLTKSNLHQSLSSKEFWFSIFQKFEYVRSRHRNFSIVLFSRIESLSNETVRRYRRRHASCTSCPAWYETAWSKSWMHPNRLHQTCQTFIRRLLFTDEEVCRCNYTSWCWQSCRCRSDYATYLGCSQKQIRQTRELTNYWIQCPSTTPLSYLYILRVNISSCQIENLLLFLPLALTLSLSFCRQVLILQWTMQMIVSVVFILYHLCPCLVSSFSNASTASGSFRKVTVIVDEFISTDVN